MQRYSFLNLARHALRGHRGWKPAWTSPTLNPSYEVIIIGGGGHGLATAYFLAKKHGVRRIALLERGWIGGGNSGRNTQVTRSNYFYPVSSSVFDHSLKLYVGLGRELNFRTYPEIGITEGHHGLSHHADRPEQIAKYAKRGTYQAELFSGFIEKLQSTPDGDGSLLDHSLFLYGAGLSNPNLHAHYDLPLAVVGGAAGRMKGGRHLVFPAETPMTNLLLTMLDKVGVQAEKLGDSTGKLPIEPLSGV
jgi:hypothetical protein